MASTIRMDLESCSALSARPLIITHAAPHMQCARVRAHVTHMCPETLEHAVIYLSIYLSHRSQVVS